MKKLVLFFLAVITIMGHASAYTFDNINVNLQNGAYLGFPYIMQHDGTFNQSVGYFQFWVNASNLSFRTGSNRTVTGVTLNNGTDVYTFNSNGSTGWLNFSATMTNASNNYSFYINNTYVESRNTTTSKQVYFNYSITDTTLKSYKINWTVSGAGGSEAVNGLIPPTPTTLQSTQGNFWINYTWSAGVGNITNSYNVSLNGSWTNGSTINYSNGTVAPHGWRNISVYAFNSSGNGALNTTSVTNNTRISNNPITISGVLASYSLTEGDVLNIDANYSDLDNDIGYFQDNASQWTVSSLTGVMSWTTEPGNYTWHINVTDNNGSVSYANFTVSVAQGVTDVTITTKAESGLTTNAVTFNGEVNYPVIGSIVTWFEYKKDGGGYLYRTENQTFNANSTFNEIVTGSPLLSNQNYIYRGVAYYNGITYYGNEEAFTTMTLPEIPDYDFGKHFTDLQNSNLNISNITSAGVVSYTDMFGSIFWGIVFLVIFICIWIVQEDVTIPALLGLIVGGSLYSLMPADWIGFSVSLMVVSLAGLVYSLMKRGQ